MQLPGFIIENLNKDQILPMAMRVWAEDMVQMPGADATMLDVIISEGKKLYFAAEMLPDMDESQIIEYRPEQFQWCVENELQIWGFLLENDILYSSKMGEYNRYVNESPTTYGMPPESPGKTGIWIGWQIIKAYMKAHPRTPIDKLLSELDAREILDGSGYKPER